MTRLIDADALLDEFEEYCDMEKCENCPFVEDKVDCGVRAKIIDAPTIATPYQPYTDIEPIKEKSKADDEENPKCDLISRADAIKELKIADKAGVCWVGGYTQRHSDFAEAIDCIKSLPSASADRPMGEWVDHGDVLMVTCSNCGYGVFNENSNNYCPRCGAYMKGDTE